MPGTKRPIWLITLRDEMPYLNNCRGQNGGRGQNVRLQFCPMQILNYTLKFR